LNPAGRLHLSLADWGKFVAQLTGGTSLLKPETQAMLLTPVPGGDYAGGWILTERKWGGGRVLNHAGSNTLNFAVAWVAPQKQLAALIVTNCGDKVARTACDEAVGVFLMPHLRTER
jgi:CubicO group peptidase (beta-lactamase class C family)